MKKKIVLKYRSYVDGTHTFDGRIDYAVGSQKHAVSAAVRTLNYMLGAVNGCTDVEIAADWLCKELGNGWTWEFVNAEVVRPVKRGDQLLGPHANYVFDEDRPVVGQRLVTVTNVIGRLGGGFDLEYVAVKSDIEEKIGEIDKMEANLFRHLDGTKIEGA